MTRMGRVRQEIRVLLHDIRSAHNVGAMLRTGDSIGASRFYFSGYTPTPIDRFGRAVGSIAKTALGAESTVPWEPIPDPFVAVRQAKADGLLVLGLEQDPRSIDYKSVEPRDMLVIVGNELEGMSESLKGACDLIAEIPRFGEKESLNVSVAFGVALFRIFDR